VVVIVLIAINGFAIIVSNMPTIVIILMEQKSMWTLVGIANHATTF